MAENTCHRQTRTWYGVLYGTPKPRYIRPLVRINGMTEDMPFGAKFDPCLMPPTILRIDTCNQTLQVNDAMVSYKDIFPCKQVAVGVGAPVNPPSDGYYPIYIDTATGIQYTYAGVRWYQTSHN